MGTGDVGPSRTPSTTEIAHPPRTVGVRPMSSRASAKKTRGEVGSTVPFTVAVMTASVAPEMPVKLGASRRRVYTPYPRCTTSSSHVPAVESMVTSWSTPMGRPSAPAGMTNTVTAWFVPGATRSRLVPTRVARGDNTLAPGWNNNEDELNQIEGGWEWKGRFAEVELPRSSFREITSVTARLGRQRCRSTPWRRGE